MGGKLGIILIILLLFYLSGDPVAGYCNPIDAYGLGC